MTASGADALLVVGLINIRYLSRFSGSDGALLLTGDTSTLLCDSRYTLQAEAESASWCSVTEYKAKVEGIAALVTKLGCRRLAIDGEKISLAFYHELAAALPGLDFVTLADELDQLRSIKTADEVAAVAHAAALASDSFREVLSAVRPGITERFLAVELEMAMKQAGADDRAFDFIVASGERGALPHGRPTERLLRAGELVTFDFGAVWEGYNSDETVTVAVGRPDARLLDIYAAVKEAHDLAIAAVKPGLDCSALDAVARSCLESRGYGAYFGHGLGHGVGLEVHEKPVVSPRSKQQLREGMIITVEPGVYIPGVGGVRIEDLLLVTADGCRVMSGIDKDLIFC
jgi:Xaa-Pro aminopeptidase